MKKPKKPRSEKVEGSAGSVEYETHESPKGPLLKIRTRYSIGDYLDGETALFLADELRRFARYALAKKAFRLTEFKQTGKISG